MKKLFLSLICAFGLCAAVVAQNAATEKVVQFDKTSTKPGFGLVYNSDVKDVNLAVKNRMTKEGLKGKAFGKNITKYEQVNMPSICAQTCDIYIKVEPSGKTASNVTCFVSKGYDNFVSSSNDPETSNLAKAFVESLGKDIDAVVLAAKIAEQEKVVKKAEDEYKKSVSEKEKIQKELDKADQNIKNMETARQNQQKILDELKAKSNQ